MSDASACVLQQVENNVQSHSRSSTPLQPLSFLGLPPEIRLIIYELVLGADRRIHIDCSVTKNEKNFMKFSVVNNKLTIDPWHNCTCYRDMYPATKGTDHCAIVSYDAQTDKQQYTSEKFDFIEGTSCDLMLDLAKTCTYEYNLGLLQTCQKVYYEARPVLYHKKTFVFWCLAAFAAYLGLSTPSGVYLSRDTEPHKLRAIQAMTKVQLRGVVGQELCLDFLSTTRLIRAGLGCLTSLESFKLGLELHDAVGERRKWRIDDSLFSMSPSLRELVFGVWSNQDHVEIMLAEEDEPDIAKELLYRILKRDDFSNTIECFRRDNDTAASTEPQ